MNTRSGWPARLAALARDPRRPAWVMLLAFLLLPPIAAYGTHGTVIVLSLAVLGLSPASLALARRLATRPPAAIYAALVLWAGLASAWAPEPANAALAALRLGLLGAAGLAFAAVLWAAEGADGRRLERTLLASVAVMALLSLGEGLTGGLVTRLTRSPEGFNFASAGKGATVPVLMAWCAAALLAERRRWAGAVAIVAVTAWATVLLPVAAMRVAMAAGAAVWLLAMVGRARAIRALAAAAVAVVLVMPALAERLPALAEEAGLPASWLHRVHIWQFVTQRIDEEPVLGLGFESSRVLGRIHDQTVVPGTAMQVLPLHPHNGMLQVRMELGVPGAVLLCALVLAVAREIWRLAAARRLWAASAAAAMAAWTVVFSVSFGAWQNWWVAAAMLAFAAFGFAARRKG